MTGGRDETRLSDLLIRWEELRELGQEVSIEEYCAGHPALADELKRRIMALRAMAPLRTGPATVTAPGTPANVSASHSASARRSAACTATYRDLRFHAAGGLGVVFMA